MKMLGDLIQGDKSYFNWTTICPVKRLEGKKLPKSKDHLCPEAIGVAYNLPIGKVEDKTWKMPDGNDHQHIGIYFKKKDGTLTPPLLLNGTNAWAAMSALGVDHTTWVGKELCVYIEKASRHPKTGKPCCAVRVKEVEKSGG